MDVTERMRRRFGDGVLSWTAGLPDLLGGLARDWHLDLGEVFSDGNSAVTVRVNRKGGPEGGPAVLKVSPEQAFAAEQAECLLAFAPSGRVPAVFDVDAARGAILMEFVEGAVAWPAPELFGETLRLLHAAVPDPARVARRELTGWTGDFLPRFTPTGPVTAAHLAVARRERDRLVESQGAGVLLHGDLHLDNLIDAGPPRGVVVIDPKACLGEPEFDAVDFVLAGGDPATTATRGPVLRGPEFDARVDALVVAADLDADRLDAWSRAMAPLVAVSAARRGMPVGELLDYAEGRI